jgi:aryl-alcohol dehydrogenase-like predicted oxidoreductase
MNEPLKTRRLGRTGLSLTELGIGTWGLCAESYGRVFPEQRTRTLVRAFEQGLRVFDMAPFWGPDGLSERAVVEAIGDKRADSIYITRAGYRPEEHGLIKDYSATALREQCEASLKRLGTDHIDIWLLHEPAEGDLKREEVRDVVHALQKAGKVRAFGVATADAHVAREALDADAGVLCLPFHLLRPQLVWDLCAEAEARGVGILARNVLFYGLLAGRWNAKKRFTPDDHRAQRFSPEALQERVQQAQDLRFLVHGPVLSMAAAAQRFVLAHDAVSSLLIGPRTPGQVEASVHAISGEPMLAEEDLARLRRMPR